MVPLYEIPEGSTDCKNCRGISLIVVGKICAGVVGDRVRNVSEGLIDSEQGGFRPGRGICKLHLYSETIG